MADATISAAQQGVYEISLSANTAYTIDVTNVYVSAKNKIQVMVHSGTAPVYAKFASTVTLKDQAATVVLPNQWTDLAATPNTAAYTVALISSAAAVVSVYRSGN